jgi:hypothetical protein
MSFLVLILEIMFAFVLLNLAAICFKNFETKLYRPEEQRNTPFSLFYCNT